MPAKSSSGISRQIAADPNNPELYLVLADELLAAGDRHGELIALQNARRLKSNAKLEKKEAELMKALGPTLFGDLWPIAKQRRKKGADRLPVDVEWFQGFMRAVRLSADIDDETTLISTLLPALVKLPAAQFVQQLSFGGVSDDNPDYGEVIELLDRTKLPTTITSLFFGDHEQESDHEHTWNMIDNFDLLSRRFPRLERLRIHSCGGLASPIELGKLTISSLRELEIITDYTKSSELVAHTTRFKKLERLTLSFGVNTYDEAKLGDVKPILDGKKLPALSSLSLEWIDFGPPLVDALVKSKLAARLVHLGIRSAHLHDASVDVLLANKASFPNLRSLDVALNYLTKPAQKRLRSMCKEVVIDTQWNPKDDYLD